jgi:type IV pilus assembly protein PilB
VLTTLHTADTLEAVVRLRDMGVASYLVSATVSLVVAQRLLRKLCRHCRRQSEPAAHESQLYRACGLAVPRVLARAAGCRCCRGEGYSGRSAVFEVMNRDGGIDRPPRRTLMAAALVAAGRFDTSFEEVVAACPAPRQSVAGANDR